MSIARSLITIITGLAAVLLAACRETSSPQPLVLRLTLPQVDELVQSVATAERFGLALAPDGRRLVFRASRGTGSSTAEDTAQLWLRDLTTGSVAPLAGTSRGVLPFWSPDGNAIGFFAEGKLRTVRVSDGMTTAVADSPSPQGGAWHPSGEIVFAPTADGPLMRRTTAGAIEPFTVIDAGETSHRLPRFFGDEHVVFFVRANTPTRQGIWIAPIDAPAARTRLVNSDAEGLPLDGALAYASGEALVVQRVNLETLALEGPSPLLGSPIGRGTEHELYATAGAELLLFGIPASSARELRWVDRVGVATGTLGEPMNASDVRIAPDGRRIAVARVDPQLRTLDIWAYDDQRPVPRRLSPNIDADESPAWSRDGRRVAWVSGRRTVTTRDSGAARADVMVHKFEHAVRVTDWSPDGRWIVVSESRPETRADIIVLSAASTPSAATRPYAQTPFNETYGTVSPDGRWLAYASDESGHVDVYVDTFPTPGRRARLSVGGGTEPRWSNDGTQVFFRRGSEVHVVHLRSSDVAQEAMSSERLFNAGGEIRSFDVTPDGRRFLLNVPIPDAAARAITAIVNVRSALPAP